MHTPILPDQSYQIVLNLIYNSLYLNHCLLMLFFLSYLLKAVVCIYIYGIPTGNTCSLPLSQTIMHCSKQSLFILLCKTSLLYTQSNVLIFNRNELIFFFTDNTIFMDDSCNEYDTIFRPLTHISQIYIIHMEMNQYK